MNIKINGKEYIIIKDYGDTISIVNLDEIITDYYKDFDYIVGDWAYGKVRLKGFYNHKNKLVKKYNDYNNVEDYIKNSCSYGCKHFILQRVEKEK